MLLLAYEVIAALDMEEDWIVLEKGVTFARRAISVSPIIQCIPSAERHGIFISWATSFHMSSLTLQQKRSVSSCPIYLKEGKKAWDKSRKKGDTPAVSKEKWAFWPQPTVRRLSPTYSSFPHPNRFAFRDSSGSVADNLSRSEATNEH